MEPSLQQRLQGAIMDWQVDWRLPKLDEHSFKRENVEIPREFAAEDEPAVAVKQEPKSGESEGEGEEDGEGGESGEAMEE